MPSLSGDFSVSKLSTAINTPIRNQQIYDAWVKFVKESGRKSTLIFTVDVQHGQVLFPRGLELELGSGKRFEWELVLELG